MPLKVDVISRILNFCLTVRVINGVGGWNSYCVDGWLHPFQFGAIPTRMARMAMGGSCPSAPKRPVLLTFVLLFFQVFQYSLTLLPVQCVKNLFFIGFLSQSFEMYSFR